MVESAPVIPNLEILSELGRGAQGIVYRARRDGRLYALKVPLRDEAGLDPPGRRLFLREAAALARIRHRALPEVFEVSSVGGVPYIILELVGGETLQHRLEQGPLPEPQLIDLACELAGALDALHRAGLAHGDVAARNVLIDCASSQVHLVDLGWMRADDDAHSLGETGLLPIPAPSLDLRKLGDLLQDCTLGYAGDPGAAAARSRRDRGSAELGAAGRLARVISRLRSEDAVVRYSGASSALRDLEGLRSGLAPAQASVGERVLVALAAPTLPVANLIGQRTELAQLRRAWERAGRGSGGVVVVRSRPGGGKTRLMWHFANEVAASGSSVFFLASDPSEPRPLAVLRQLIEAYLSAPPAEARGAQSANLQRLAGDVAPLLRVLSPAVAQALGVLPPGPPPNETHPVFADAIAEFVLRLLRELGPAMLIVEDAQWLDAVSRRVLARAASDAAKCRALFVFTARTDSAATLALQKIEQVLDPGAVAHIEIAPLREHETADLIKSYLGGGGAADESLLRHFVTLSGGTPLRALELVRATLEEGALVPHWGSWKLDRELLAAIQLPSGIRELLARRIAGLEPMTGRTLRACAVLGLEFEDALLPSVLDSTERAVAAGLAEARTAGLIEPLPGRHRFVHHAVREAMIAATEPEDARRLHQRCAEVLDARLSTGAAQSGDLGSGSSDELYAVATHYADGVHEEAADRRLVTNVAAGRLALESYDERALGFLAAAAAASERLDRGRDAELEYMVAEAELRIGRYDDALGHFRQSLRDTSDVLLKAMAHSRMAWIHMQLDAERAWSDLEAAFSLLGERPPRDATLETGVVLAKWLIRAAGPQTRAPPERARRLQVVCALYYQTARLAFHTGRLHTVLQLAVRSLPLAERLGPSPELARAYSMYAFALTAVGLRVPGQHAGQRGRELAERLGDPLVLSHSLQLSSVVAVWGGDFEAAWQLGARLLDEFGHWRELGEYCLVCYNQYAFDSMRGRWSRAWTWVERALRKVNRHDLAPLALGYLGLTGRAALTTLGRDSETAKHLGAVSATFAASSERSAYDLIMLAMRIKCATELEVSDAELSALLSEVEPVLTGPGRAALAVQGVFVQIAHARASMCLRASPEERPTLLAAFRKALADVVSTTRIPVYKAHLRALQACERWLAGSHGHAGKLFAEAERRGAAEDAPWVLYTVHRGRAHMLRAQGRLGAALEQARLAYTVARAHGAVHRARWIREEFPEAALEAAPAQPAVSSPSRHPGERGPLRTLLSIGRAHPRDLDPRRQAKAVVDELITALEANRGLLYLVPEGGDRRELTQEAMLELFVARAEHGADCDDIGADQDLIREAAGCWSLATGEEGPPSVITLSRSRADARGSRVAAPLVSRRHLLGVLYLERAPERAPLGDAEAHLVNVLADQIPVALELARALSERERELERVRSVEKREAMERMAGGIAHDFNNLLAAIRVSTDAMLAHCRTDASVRDELVTIQTATANAAALTRQLLAFCRGQHLEEEVIELNVLVERGLPLLTRIAGTRVRVHTELTPARPRIKGDASQIDRVLVNLVTNARDAMPHGGTVRIETAITELDDHVAAEHQLKAGTFAVLAISDTGTGIPESIRGKVFDPFFTTKEHGTGLGLASVQGIVSQSGGFIVLDSDRERGTRFAVHFPATAQAAVRQDRTSVAPAAHDPANTTVLLADDDDLLRGALTRLLRSIGYRVLAAADGHEALELADGAMDDIAVVVTDVTMPGMSGRELVAELAKRRPDLKVIYTSGHDQGELAGLGTFGRNATFLSKPVSFDALEDALERAIGETS